MEGQESSLVGRAGSSGGRSNSSGPHLQQVRRETSSVTQSVPRTTADHVDHQLMSWREQIVETCGNQLVWHGCEHTEHKH